MKKNWIIIIALAVVVIAICFIVKKNNHAAQTQASQNEVTEVQQAEPVTLTVVAIEPTTAPQTQVYQSPDMQNCTWASVSPNSKKKCYYVIGEGCYICDQNGENEQFIARDLRAAKWLNDNVIVGMEDKDDGEALVSSAIVAYNIETKEKTVLTPDTMIATDPEIVEGGVVCTVGDEYYLIKLQ